MLLSLVTRSCGRLLLHLRTQRWIAHASGPTSKPIVLAGKGVKQGRQRVHPFRCLARRPLLLAWTDVQGDRASRRRRDRRREKRGPPNHFEVRRQECGKTP